MNMVLPSVVSVDKGLLTTAASDVAFKWLHVLHIRLNLPEN